MTSALGMVAACATGSPGSTAFAPPDSEAALSEQASPPPDRDTPGYVDLSVNATFTAHTV